MRRALRVLNIEDSPLDAVLLQRHLTKEGYDVTLERVDTAIAMTAALEAEPWDVILSDHAMPKFSAMGALTLLKETGLDIPFIIISGAIGEELAVEAMRAGAADYMMKDRLARLAAAIERERLDADTRRARREAEAEMARLGANVQRERERQEQQLRDQQFYARSLIESNIDALITTDPAGLITDVNAQTEALTGRARDELIGSPFRNHFTDSSRAQLAISRVLEEGKVTNYELTALGIDGTHTVVSYNATTFYNRDQVLQGVFASARDMTESKEVEQRLQKKHLALEYATRLKSEFLANMSHELRTPLHAIIGFSEALRDGLTGAITDQQRAFVVEIFDNGSHLHSLISDILDLSKVDAGEMALELEPVQVSRLLADTLAIGRLKAKSRHIRMSMEAAGELGVAQLDLRKVKQIVQHLLSNAVKFNLEGGQVMLRASRVPRDEVGAPTTSWTCRTMGLADSDFQEFLKVSVADSGIGIAPAQLHHLFKLFSQVDSGLARQFDGAGLGLAMVKLLTELHGGAVAVESAVGEGSCFTVWLPVGTPDERPTEIAAGGDGGRTVFSNR